MSNSFYERANPPPRRKTCVACTKAKRRCDQGQPACLRCSRRKMDCVYPSPPPPSRSKGPAIRRAPQPSTSPVVPGDSPPSVKTPAVAPTAVEDETPCPASSLVPWSQGLDLLPLETGVMDDINLDMNFDEFLDPDTLFDSTLSLPALSPKPPQMIVPSHSVPPQTSLEEMIASRLQYSLDAIKKTPATMVSETQTPWSHPHLYRAYMPPEMEDALACCALYTAKNKHNSLFVLRAIQARAHALISSPLPKGRLEILARVHAMLLYQIIRLFDGDIAMRASAQQTLSAIEPAIFALLPFVKWDRSHPNVGPAEPQSLCPTKEFWTEWIFQESARRTIFFTCFLSVAYELLTGQPRSNPACVEKYIVCQSWTLSAHLWNAPNVVDFSIAWRDKRHFVVDQTSFTEVLGAATVGDIDLFGKILMVGALGIEEARLWFFNRDGTL